MTKRKTFMNKAQVRKLTLGFSLTSSEKDNMSLIDGSDILGKQKCW